MNNLDPLQIWLLMAAVAYIAFMAGRATARKGGGESREAKALRIQGSAENAFSSLTPSIAADVDRLLNDGKTIEAIKVMREHTGLGLKESKQAIDWRKRLIKS